MRLEVFTLSLALLGAAPAAPALSEASTHPSPLRPAPCPIVAPGDWTAHLNAMPGPGSRPTLIVTGSIRVKPATRAVLRLDPAVMESDPPQYSVILDVRVPRAPTIDMMERREIRGEWPVSGRVGAVHISCGGRRLATVREVVTAH